MNMLKVLRARISNIVSEHPRISVVTLILFCAILSISRRPESITNAQFWAEDGRYWYADAYNEGALSSLSSTYAGYLVVTYRLVASISLLLPINFAPLFFNLMALVIQLLPVALITSSRFNHILKTRRTAYLLSIIYVLLPNITEVHINLTNIQWHLGITSFLILISKHPRTIKWKLFDFSVILATGLAGPLVLLLLPISVIVWRGTKSKASKFNALLLALLATIQFISIFILSNHDRVGGQPNADPIKFIKMVSGQIFSGGLLGEASVNIFYDTPVLLYSSFATLVLLTIFVLLKSPTWLKLFNIFAIISIFSMLVSLKHTDEFDTWLGLTNPGGGQRYWYIPIVVWVTNIMWLASYKKSKLPRAIASCLLFVLIFVGIPKDWRLRDQPNVDFQTHSNKFKSLPSGAEYTFPINPGWDMKLTKK